MMHKSKRLKICYVLNTFDLGGAESVALNLARAHDKSRFDVEIVGAMDPASESVPVMLKRCREEGVRAISLGQPNLRSPRALFRFYNYLRRGRFDIVMGHNRGSDYWAVKLGALAGVPHRYLARHLVYPDVDERHRKRYRSAAASVHRVIAVSEAVRQSCIEVEMLSNVRIDTIENGIDTGRFAPIDDEARSRIRREIGHPADHLMLLFVGRFSDQKAPEAFLRLVALLNENGRKVVGYMCGHGPLGDQLSLEASASGGEVRILGLRSDVPGLLGACDLFVSTSRYEGLPLNIMEAMSVGVPFVGPAIPQVLQLVRSEPAFGRALFAPPPLAGPVPNDLIDSWVQVALAFTADAADMAECGSKGRRVIESEFSLEKMVTRYEAVFLEDSGMRQR